MHLLGMNMSDRSSRRRLALIAASSVIAQACRAGVYGLATGPSPPSPSTSVTTSGRRRCHRLRGVLIRSSLLAMSRPRYSRDTTTGLLPLDYTSTILAVGDPSGAEQAGLANDVAAYLPSRAVWPGPA